MDKFIHPELKENELFMMNIRPETEKDFLDKVLISKISGGIHATRMGEVAYKTGGKELSEGYKPVFAIPKVMKATYTSVWDDGIEFTTNCEYDTQTKDATNIVSIDVEGVDILMDEYLTLENGFVIKAENFTIDGQERE